MPEPYEWEWLKQPSDEDPEAEDAHQLKNLRRWIDSIDPDAPDAQTSPAKVERRPYRLSRWQRRQQLKQMQASPAKHISDSIEQRQSPVEFSLSGQLQSEPEMPLAHPGTLSPHEPLPEPSTQQPIENGAKKMPKKKDDYRDHLKQEFNTLFENLNLQPQQKHYLKSRWLDQVLWMEGRSGKARDMHYRLRLTTIIGGVIIPALVSLNFTGNDQAQFKQAIAASTFFLSQAVAISAATEQFFNYGDRWRHYRRSVESLKTQGWQFFELTGPYESSKTHEQAFSVFANQVEQILQHDVEIYSTQVTQAKQNEKQEEEQSTSSSPANGRVPDPVRQS